MSASPCAPSPLSVPTERPWPGIELIRPPLQPTSRTTPCWIADASSPLPAALGCDLVALLCQESFAPGVIPQHLLALRILPQSVASLWCYLPLPAAIELDELTPELIHALALESLSSARALVAIASTPQAHVHPAPPTGELLRVWTGLRLSEASRALLAQAHRPAELAALLASLASHALRGPIAAAGMSSPWR